MTDPSMHDALTEKAMKIEELTNEKLDGFQLLKKAWAENPADFRFKFVAGMFGNITMAAAIIHAFGFDGWGFIVGFVLNYSMTRKRSDICPGPWLDPGTKE